MRILIAGINYRPEVTSVGPYTAGLAEYLVGRGDQVTVITGLAHYPAWRLGPRTRRVLWARETVGGVDVIRAAHYVPFRQSALKRAAYEITNSLTGLLAATSVSRPDAVLGIVPSLSGGVIAKLAAGWHRVPYGLLFQDLMGPAARQSGVPGGGRVASATVAAERWVVRRAAAVAVVSRAFEPYMVGLGVRSEAIHHVANWSKVADATLTTAETRQRFGWDDGRTVVLHAGNIGFKQGLEQVIDAARLAADRGQPIRFVLAGGGNRTEAIREAASDLPNVEFIGVQSDGIHASLLAAADVLLLSERGSQMDMSLPSKLTSYFAAGRPIVAAVPSGGASAGEIERAGAGIVVPADQPQALLEAVAMVRDDPDLAARLGSSGRHYAGQNTASAACLERAGQFVDAISDRPPAQLGVAA